MAFSLKHEKVIEMENALKYPLGPIPLSIANADGTARVTKKSALAKIILAHLNPSTETATTNKGTFIVDFIAQIRTMKNIPDTYEELTLSFIKSLPRDYQRIDVVADTYLENYIKRSTRSKRGWTERIIITSCKSKILRDFHKFLLVKIKWDWSKLCLGTLLKTIPKYLTYSELPSLFR